MSATPKIYELEDNYECNYNIEDILGKIVYKMDFNYAITNNYISNYEIYLPIYDEDNYNKLLKLIQINNYEDLLIKKVLYYFESIKILGKLKTIIYFNSHEHIDMFIKCFNDINYYYNYKYNIDSIICSDTKNNRNKKLEDFNKSDDISILCSVGILDECVDIISCNSVYITYNCVSKIRIIQRISRALRKYNNKIAKILIWCENINTSNPIISAIKEIDNDIIKKIKYINYNNKILSLDEKNNIQKNNRIKNENQLNKITKYEIYNPKLLNNNIINFLKTYSNINNNFICDFFNTSDIFVVSSNNLLSFLHISSRKDFHDTIKRSYVENIDYIITKPNIKGIGKNNEKIYLLTIESAKMILQSTKSKKGNEVRHYFIEIEKMLYKYKDLIIKKKASLIWSCIINQDLAFQFL
jgi:phage anti-repressor protein